MYALNKETGYLSECLTITLTLCSGGPDVWMWLKYSGSELLSQAVLFLFSTFIQLLVPLFCYERGRKRFSEWALACFVKFFPFISFLNGRLLVPLLSVAIWNSYFFSLDIIGRCFV